MHSNPEKWHRLLTAGMIAGALAGCGGGGDGGGDATVAPASPTGVAATPGNGILSVSWDPVSGATSYKVYYGSSEGVTTGDASVTSASTPVSLPGLSNNTPYYLKVAAVNSAGSSALSTESCGVPSAGAALAVSKGLTVWDPLCASSFDGSKWVTPRFERKIDGGAAVLAVSADNLEARSTRGYVPTTAQNVQGVGAANRVTNLQTVISVAQSGTVATGAGLGHAGVQFLYQPAGNLLAFSGGNAKLIFAQVGIHNDAAGPRFRSTVGVCVTASCAVTDTATGIVYANNTFPEGQAASYDTPYTFRLAFDETTRIFTFEVSGGALGGTRSGTANASSLFTNQGVDPVNDMLAARIRAMAQDTGSGGGDVALRASFDDVQAGFNTAGAAGPATLSPYDDFGGSGGNSGPDFLLAKWTANESSASFANGGMATHNKMTGVPSSNYKQSVEFNIGTTPPAAVSVDATITSVTTPATYDPENTQHAYVRMTLYNDGSSGVPFDRTGDVNAGIALVASGASFYIFKCADPRCSGTSVRMQAGNTGIPAGSVPFGLNTTHTLGIAYDSTSHLVTFRVDDGAPRVVDPQTMSADINPPAPYAAPANASFANFGTLNRVFTTGEDGAVDGYFNNFMIKQ
jgi:hypothetical protein